jgi:hypothetical protein
MAYLNLSFNYKNGGQGVGNPSINVFFVPYTY